MTYEPPASDETRPGPSTTLEDLRRIRRVDDGKVVAGVLGGVGRHFGIDPLLLRVTTVVLAIFGGVGVLFYALGWLMLPRDNGPSLLDEARGRAADRSSAAVPLAVALGLVAVVALTNVITDSWDGTVLLLLTVAGLYVLMRQRDEQRRDEAGVRAEPDQVADMPGRSASTASGTATTDAPSPSTYPPGYTDGWPEGPDWEPEPPASTWDAAEPQPWDVPAAPVVTDTPEPPQRRSILTPVTLALAALAALAVYINDVTWADVPEGMYVAVPLAVVGLGLLTGLRRRRVKGLVATGIVLSTVLVPLTAFGHFVQPALEVHATTVAEVDGTVVEQPAGEVLYDLTEVPFSDGDTARMVFDQGLGSVTVLLPPDVDATVRYSGGLGEATILDNHFEGAMDGQTITDNGADGEGGGSITLIVTLGVGEVLVTR